MWVLIVNEKLTLKIIASFVVISIAIAVTIKEDNRSSHQ